MGYAVQISYDPSTATENPRASGRFRGNSSVHICITNANEGILMISVSYIIDSIATSDIQVHYI
jgi:hypothetical protein